MLVKYSFLKIIMEKKRELAEHVFNKDCIITYVDYLEVFHCPNAEESLPPPCTIHLTLDLQRKEGGITTLGKD